MIFTTISLKMCSSTTTTNSSSSCSSSSSYKCKSFKWMDPSIWLVLVFVAGVFTLNAQAGVIKKREIHFTTETAAAATTTTTLATEAATLPTITVKRHDHDIAQSDLSLESKTPATASKTTTEFSSTPETFTQLLEIKPNDTRSINLKENNQESSKENVHNEISLNETRKEQEKAEIESQKIISEKIQENIDNKNLLNLPTKLPYHFENPNQIHTNSKTNSTWSSPPNKVNNENELKLTENVTEHLTFAPSKATSIDTNPANKHAELTTPVVLAAKDLLHSETIENVPAGPESSTAIPFSQIFSALMDKNEQFLAQTTTVTPLKIQDGLDRESLKEISNDLPEKTTEPSMRTETLMGSNKSEHARSMLISSSEDLATTLPYREEKDIETSTSVPQSHLYLKNSIDIEDFTPMPSLGEKKAKFINDNSTNAQKLNLPNNAEVWSLVGMKPITSNGASSNVSMETAPKHKDLPVNLQEIEEAKNNDMSSTISSISNSIGEKVLLDWSQIVRNKELATTVNYPENNENNFNGALRDINTLPTVLTDTLLDSTTNVPISETLVKNSSLSDINSASHANSSTILSVSSFDNNFEYNHKHTELTSTSPTSTSSSPSSVINIGDVDATTEIIPTSTTTIASTASEEIITNLDLNKINLTLNKTKIPTENVGELVTERKDEQQNTVNNRDGQGNVQANVNVYNDVTTEAPTYTTTKQFDTIEQSDNNNSYSKTTTESTTTTINTAETTTTMAASTLMPAPSTADSISSEPTIAFSTHETGKVNASNNNSSERNSIFDESDKKANQGIKSDENDDNQIHAPFKKGNNENIEIFSTTTTTAIPITTYRPKYVNLDLNAKGEELLQTTTNNTNFISATPTKTSNKAYIAEVNDQNGNEIEHKKSINVEEITQTTTDRISGSLNNSSTTIKAHLNEQVFAISSTTTTTPVTTIAATTTTTTTTPYTILTTTESTETSGKTTSSSANKDEIITNGKDFQLNINNTITTPKSSTTTTTITTNSPFFVTSTTTEQVEQIAIGSSSSPLEQNAAHREFETTTETSTTTTTSRTDTSETPVVALPTAITTQEGVPTKSSQPTIATSNTVPTLPPPPATTTTTSQSSNEEVEKDTKKLDTDLKIPIHNKGEKLKEKEEEQEEESTVEPTKDVNLETTTMSMQTINNATQKEEVGINIKFINETDNSITNSPTTSTAATTTTTVQTLTNEIEEKIHTTTTPTSSSSTPPQPPPTTTLTPTNVNSDADASTEITNFNKQVISTASNIPLSTTHSSEENSDITSEYPLIYPTTRRTTPTPSTTANTLTNNINEDFVTTLSNNNYNNFNEEFTTMIPPNIITANIGGGEAGVATLPPLRGGSSGNMFPKNSEASGETDVNVIIAITVSVIGVIALILLVAFLYLMRKRQKQTSYSQRCRPVSLDEYAIDNASVGGSMRKGSALRSSKRTYGNLAFDDPSLRHNPMGVHDLAKFSVEKLRIFEEFRDVPQITAREDEVPQGCEDKNRFANVLPLPESRVVLQRLNDDYKTEYINANYVTGPKDTPNYYIACQAPLDSTVEDFWRMIWEQQSRVIIQATDLIENGVEKCAEYLPPSVTLDNHSTFGDFQITLQNREVKDKYAISTILLKHNAENATRELTHYWYKWPETGVPTEEAPIIAMLLEARSSLISYAIEQANEDKEKSSNATLKSAEEGTASVAVVNGASAAPAESNVSVNGGSGGGRNGEINGNISMVPLKKTARNQGPLTIHCSPGTGRTGTIIACDIAIRSLETPKRTVDVPQIVYYVRRGRASAVLTKEQYEFIYKVANVYAAKISNPSTYH